MVHQHRAGRRPKGRQCEAFPTGGAMSIDRALTQRLIKTGEYKKYRWNRPSKAAIAEHEKSCVSRPAKKDKKPMNKNGSVLTNRRTESLPLHATKVIKSQILAQITKTIESMKWSYGGVGGVVRDHEMQHSIACHKAALSVITATPASAFPLGRNKKHV
jgi:hypothetical protein